MSTVALMLSGAAGVAPPTFPLNFYVGMQQWTVLNHGGAHWEPDGSVCCAHNDTQCSMQSYSLGNDVFQYGTQETVRIGGTMNNYTGTEENPHGIQYAVEPAGPNSTHKWACAEYCPLDKSFFSLVEIGDGLKYDQVKFEGNVTVAQTGCTPLCQCVRGVCGVRGVRGVVACMACVACVAYAALPMRAWRAWRA